MAGRSLAYTCPPPNQPFPDFQWCVCVCVASAMADLFYLYYSPTNPIDLSRRTPNLSCLSVCMHLMPEQKHSGGRFGSVERAGEGGGGGV